MKSIIFSILIIVNFNSTLCGQAKKDLEKYEKEIYIQLLDTLNSMLKFDFYESHLLHIDTKEYALRPMDSFKVLNPITYHESVKLGLDLKVEGDSINLDEAKLFKYRFQYPNGIFLVGKIEKKRVHKNVELDKHISLPEYPDISKINNFKEKYIVDNKLGKYDAFLAGEKHGSRLKYDLKALVFYSGIQWNKNKNIAVVECGFHYSYGNRGKSGGGFLAVVEKANHQIKILKLIGLWEE